MSDTDTVGTNGTDDTIALSMDRAHDAFACYERYLKWRFAGAHHTAVTPKSLESATEEFWRFWDRACAGPVSQRHSATSGVVAPPKPLRESFTRKDLVKRPPKAEARQPPPKPRKRLITADRRDRQRSPKKSRVQMFVDSEAEEVSHRRAQEEDDALETEDEGSMKDFIAPDGEPDGQGSSPLH